MLAQTHHLSPATIGKLTAYQIRDLYMTPVEKTDVIDVDEWFAENNPVWELMATGLTRAQATAKHAANLDRQAEVMAAMDAAGKKARKKRPGPPD